MRQERKTNKNFSLPLRKPEGCCGTWPGILQDPGKAYKLKISATSTSEQHEAGISTEGLRNHRIPSRVGRRRFSPEVSQGRLREEAPTEIAASQTFCFGHDCHGADTFVSSLCSRSLDVFPGWIQALFNVLSISF